MIYWHRELLKGLMSDSAWAVPILLVPKPDGSSRLCTDFRKLNAVTITDPFPMPRVDDLLDKLGNSKFMTKLDMSKDYWQISIRPEDVPLTAFVTPHGTFCLEIHGVWI